MPNIVEAVVGRSTGTGGDAIWIMELDSLGNKVWEKSFGGNNNENVWGFDRKKDSGYILGAWTMSSDIMGFKGVADGYLINLDSAGNLIWAKCFGGAGGEQFRTVGETPAGDFIVGGPATAAGGDIVGFNGVEDYWVMKLDAAGNVKWSKCYGGNKKDELRNLVVTEDGGAILNGISASFGDDVWLVRIDSMGDVIWDTTLGSTWGELAGTVITTCDNGYAFHATATTHDKDVTGTVWGWADAWLVKLAPDGRQNKTCIPDPVDTTTAVRDNTQATVEVRAYPNPFVDQLEIEHPGEMKEAIVYNVYGQEMHRVANNNAKMTVNGAAWPPGQYILKLSLEDGSTVVQRLQKL